jgi:CheY-like chemotaxis protein
MTRRRVLVVDDDDDVREVTTFSLELIGGYEVIDANGGARAIELARSHLPDLVLLDVMMPGMDGPATFRALRADPATAHIPVVLLTAKVPVGMDHDEHEGLAGVISKPFDPRALVAEIERILQATDGEPAP